MELNTHQVVNILRDKDIHVGASTISNWAKKGLIVGWQSISRRWYFESESILSAISDGTIPPSIGRERRYSDEQRQQMKELKESGKTLLSIAKIYKCDQSFVSLVVRGLR